MTSKPPRSADRALAAYEGALPPSLFAFPTSAAQSMSMWSPQMTRHSTLQELLKLINRIPHQVESWAKVRQMREPPHFDTLWLAKDAEHFLNLVAALAREIVGHTRAPEMHPRVKVLFAKVADALDLRHSSAALLDRLKCEPWDALAKLDALLSKLRKVLFSRSQIERELLYEQRQAKELSELRSTFKAIVEQDRNAVVLRVELYRTEDLTDLAYPAAAIQAATRRHGNWLKQVKKALGTDLVHVQETRQVGSDGETGIHVMLIVKNRPQKAVDRLHDEVLDLWTDIAGNGAHGVACKGTSSVSIAEAGDGMHGATLSRRSLQMLPCTSCTAREV